MNILIAPETLQRVEKIQPSAGGRKFSITTPLDGSVVAHVADCGPDEARRAIDLAAEAFVSWKQTTAWERSRIMQNWLNLLREHEAELARLITIEMGKPVSEAVGELRYSAGFVEWSAEEAKRVYGEMIPSQFAHKRLLVTRQPSGVVYGITAWNFPHATVTRKVAPALAAGCTFILKPAEQTPLSALYLAALWEEAGGPHGTFQVLPALDPVPVSEVLLNDHRVRVLTFTGSTAVGKHLYQSCAPTMKRLALELGGHAPFLIFSDVDLDAAVREAVSCKFRNGGQTCVCTNRIYVHEDIAQPFTQRLVAAVEALKVGDPLDPSTQIGPVVNSDGLRKIEEHLRDAVAKGARVETGGKAREGLYHQPTVLTGVNRDMLVMREETFGPVAPVMTFRDDVEAIRLANDTRYGLAGYLWTRDLARAFRVSEALEFGIIGVNDGIPSAPQAPMGGIKDSGLGREGGRWSLDEFLDVKYVSMSLP